MGDPYRQLPILGTRSVLAPRERPRPSADQLTRRVPACCSMIMMGAGAYARMWHIIELVRIHTIHQPVMDRLRSCREPYQLTYPMGSSPPSPPGAMCLSAHTHLYFSPFIIASLSSGLAFATYEPHIGLPAYALPATTRPDISTPAPLILPRAECHANNNP